MRRGMTSEAAIITVIVFAAVMILGIVIFNSLSGASKASFTDSECRASAMLTRAGDLSPICSVKPQNPIPLKCERNFVTVDEEVILNGEDVTKEYAGACPGGGTGCIGEEALAKEMERCWRMFMEGEQAVFQQLEIDEWSLKSETNARVCFVCSEVTLEEGAPQFGEYVRAMASKKNITYYEYFTSPRAYCDPRIKEPTCWEGMAKSGEVTDWVGGNKFDKIEQDNLPAGAYAVVFMRRGMGTCEEKEITKELEAQAMTNTVQAVPAANISRHCGAVIV